MYIYKTVNLIDGKFYIGKCERSLENSKYYLGSGLKLQRAIKKHGIENFKREILCECLTKEELAEKEKYFIEITNARVLGYNIAEGGNGGKTLTLEQISERSESRKGENNHFKGRHHSEKTKQKISYKNKGKQRSLEHRLKQSKKLKEMYDNGERTHHFTKECREQNKLRMKKDNPSFRANIKEKASQRIKGENNPSKRQDVKEKLSKAKKGENNPNAKVWIFTNKDGSEVKIIGSIIQFCREQNISEHAMWNIAKGRDLKNLWRNNWTCKQQIC